MIIYYNWMEKYGLKVTIIEGWYLFGFIPLYVRKVIR